MASTIPVKNAINPSCFGTLDAAASDVAALRGRVCGLVDRLAGTYPEPAQTAERGEIKGVPNGTLTQAMEDARNIREWVSTMNSALDRLEAALP